MNKDLTLGKPLKVIILFCLPLLGSIIFQQLYNIADSVIAGKFINDNALAAVGNGYEITLLFIAFAFGCNVGCSVVVARLFGAGKYNDMKTAVYTTFIAGAVLCVLLMLCGYIFCDSLLAVIKTPEEVFQDSETYLYIYILGLPFVFFYNISTGIFSAMGDSRTPFYFLVASSLSNIGMDILFVAGFNLGVPGLAYATVLCQGVSCILAVIFILLRLNGVRTEGKLKVFSFAIFKDIAYVAIPSILQQSFVSVGNIIIQGIINSFGTAVMAGYSAGIKLNNLIITSFVTLGNGISNYTSQNIGAEKPERIKPGFRAGLIMVCALAVPVSLLYFFAGKYLMLIFMQDISSEGVFYGEQLLRIIVPFYIIISVKVVSDGIMRGASRMIQFTSSTFLDLILRVVISLVLAPSLGPVGIWISWPVGWVLSSVLSLFYYFHYEKQLEKNTAGAALQGGL